MPPIKFHLINLGLFTILITLLSQSYSETFPQTITNSYFIVVACYCLMVFLCYKKSNLITPPSASTLLPVATITFASAIILIAMLRIEYSRSVLLIGACVSLVGLALIRTKEVHNQKNFIVLDNFDVEELKNFNQIKLIQLSPPYSLFATESGLIVNFHHTQSDDQEHFIADCTINNIPVYHSEYIKEILSRQVSTTHLTENTINYLISSSNYKSIKRFIEVMLIVVSLPISLLVMSLISIMVAIEKEGSIFFVQQRVGYQGRLFNIYKFRTMKLYSNDCNDCNDCNDKFASQESERVTPFGRFLRNSRLDELPQFFNILKGDMSLIGPRPEQVSFTKLYESDIPFYQFRHNVKPGITGWAQVEQGYTDSTESTATKLGYDLYYIKHFSLRLDIHIAIKTVWVMLKGKGAM